ncbi:hypothetical protein GUY44_00070 [Pimelobacter simplex]|uniref:Uncharacterized protein n=1 Tax=Nocardioides simplex TaxID=2045 RepID=A0A0A1DQQ9_NOCSI|nr:hypothetical protein [Pimelobacter simplex]AIY18927.1 hypothetical protein KR76_22980 [Pimelobacter simplex]MCG8148855.1 hypothetical protein [Pimelobacter simplex]SFM26981.1 hypothetical protein SAMN05421671_0744 [Pimelobacter simplex]
MTPRRWLVLVVAVALVAAVAAVVVVRLRGDDASRFSAALELAPTSTQRYSWTDWAGVREELGVRLSDSSSPEDVDDFLQQAYDRDLSSMTALSESAPTIQQELGFSPATLDWELFAQGRDGALVIMGLPESYDIGRLRERLRTAGFLEPPEADGVWEGGVDLLEGFDGPVTPELAALQVDEKNRLLIGSDDAGFLAQRTDLARGDEDDAVAEAVAAAGPALSAAAYTGDQVCTALAMSEADPAERTRASELLKAAGEVHPIAGYAMAAQPGGDVRVAMAFETAEQARSDADSRSRLAAGPAPGQGGSFTDRYRLGKVVASDKVLTLALDPVAGAFVLSDLTSGPVLFATC